MRKFRIVLALVLIVSVALFALRHRLLRQLKTEQEQLHQELSTVQAPIPSAIETKSPSTNVTLSAAERSEFLRLRGQIGALRHELTQMTNQTANSSRSTQ